MNADRIGWVQAGSAGLARFSQPSANATPGRARPCSAAMKCTDFSELDAAKVMEQGADYVDKLNAIFTCLSSESTDNPQPFERETLEKEAGRDLKAKTQIDGKLGLLDATTRLDTSFPQATRLLSLPKPTSTDSFRQGTGRTDQCRRRRGGCRR